MSTDYEDKEREFLSYLKADTGRDLAGWMVAISEANLAHRNEVIDWLRQQGFIFAWASWLERIHHGGGRPIYLSEVPPSLDKHQRAPSVERPATSAPPPLEQPPPEPPVRAAPTPSRPVLVYTAPAAQKPRDLAPKLVATPSPGASAAEAAEPAKSEPITKVAEPAKSEPTKKVAEPAKLEPTIKAAEPAKPASMKEAAAPAKPKPARELTEPARPPQREPQTTMPAAGSTGLNTEVSALVAKAKAYAPLAGFILRSLSEALPGTIFQASKNYISCNRPETFAILVPGPKDIKLGIALDAAPFEREIVTARFPNLSPAPSKAITHMIILTDARQIDAALMDLLRSANVSVNG